MYSETTLVEVTIERNNFFKIPDKKQKSKIQYNKYRYFRIDQ